MKIMGLFLLSALFATTGLLFTLRISPNDFFETSFVAIFAINVIAMLVFIFLINDPEE